MFGFLSDLLFCSYDNGWTLNFDIKLLRTEKKSVNRHIFFFARNLTCSSLHQGRFGICHRRRTPGNTYIKLHIPASIFHRMPWKDCLLKSPNLWMWKPIRVLGLLRLLEDSSVAPVALLFHLVEGLVSNKWITRSLLVEVVVVNNKIFALMSCWLTTRYIKNASDDSCFNDDRFNTHWFLLESRDCRWLVPGSCHCQETVLKRA